jgi:ectoine hydroxylase-related dioxygenase (phytanoyl-CoA dioxygenase family)
MTVERAGFVEQIEHVGYAVIPAVLRPAEVDALRAAVERLSRNVDLGVRGGVRDLFSILPEAGALATHSGLCALAESVLGPGCAAVRGILFDKTPGANWKVAWHQDLTIAVAQRTERPGFGPWSEKAGIVHVQPPVAILEGMLTLRVHLDDCGLANGPVRVLPGSHRAGRLSPQAVDRWRAEVAAVDCGAAAGDVLAMRPLLLHASSPAASPAHRRVVHLEYAAATLLAEIDWRERWRPGAPEARAG